MKSNALNVAEKGMVSRLFEVKPTDQITSMNLMWDLHRDGMNYISESHKFIYFKVVTTQSLENS